MGSLLKAMKGTIEDKKLGFEIQRAYYSTGVDYVDFMNGKMTSTGILQIGICGGKIFYIAGKSGSGKSSLGLEAGFNIIKDVEDGLFIVYDAEKSNSHERIAAVNGIDFDTYNQKYRDEKVMLMNSNTSSDGLLALVEEIHKTKVTEAAGAKYLKKGTKYQRDNTKKATKEDLEAMPPTVIMVDSWVMLSPEDFEDVDGSRTNMAAAQIAKANNGVIKSINNKMFEANIILIIINHIGTAIKIGQYDPDKRPLKWLKENETLPAGETAVYEADYLLRAEQSKKLHSDKEFKIDGFYTDVTTCKSRSNASGLHMSLVFDSQKGFSNTITNFILMKNNGRINGSGHGYWVDDQDQWKFKQAELVDLYDNDNEFAEYFSDVARDILGDFVRGIEAGADMQLEEQPDVTPDDVQEMNITAIKEFAKQENVYKDIDWASFKGKDALTDARTAITEAIWDMSEV